MNQLKCSISKIDNNDINIKVMNFKKNASNNAFEPQYYSDDSYQNNELNKIPSYNNISINLNSNFFPNDINESILDDGNSISNFQFNPSYLNIFNHPNINEIERPTNESTLNNKGLKFVTKKLGRKRKSDNAKSIHNKYSDDILRRKVKCILLKDMMIFINEKIYEMYDGNIGHNIYRKELLTINGDQNSNATIKFNQNFLNKTLGDIFSVNISSKYTDYEPNHNKRLIEYLKNKEDETKRLYFNKLFNLTFLQCLNHYIGKESIEELNGLICFNEKKNTIDEDEEYIEALSQQFNTYEERIMKKKEREKRKIQNS